MQGSHSGAGISAPSLTRKGGSLWCCELGINLRGARRSVFCSAGQKAAPSLTGRFYHATALAIYFEDKQASSAAPNFLWRVRKTESRERRSAGYLWRVHATRANKYQGGVGGCDKKLHLARACQEKGQLVFSVYRRCIYICSDGE